MKIFINPGHAPGGNPDPGAVNKDLGIRECDIAMTIGSHLANWVEQAGQEVKLLQSDNLAGESWGDCVVDEANEWPADLFVSIHCNAFNGRARGAETLYYPGSAAGLRLAECVQSRLAALMTGLDPDFPDRGVKPRPDLAVLRCTNMPAILVETAFIDQEADAYFLMNYGDEMARVIGEGVLDFGQTAGN